MFEGSADLATTLHERPAWVRRLQQEGDLKTRLVDEQTSGRRVTYYLAGYSVMALCLFLFIGAVVNALRIHW
jgi:hypothetical protein